MKDVNTIVELVAYLESQGLQIREQSAFYKVEGSGKAIYLQKTKGKIAQIHVAGFSVDHPSVHPLTAEEAKAKRLGKVRGIIHPDHTPEGVDWKLGLLRAVAALRNERVVGTKKDGGSSKPFFVR